MGCWDVYSRDILDCGEGLSCPISVAARDGGLSLLVVSSGSFFARLRNVTVEVLSILLPKGVTVWVGVETSGVDSLRPYSGEEPSILVRRASSRLMTLELALASGSMLAPRRSLGSGRAASVRCAVEGESLLPVRDLAFGSSGSGGSSANAMQSSVRLRHMLSAFLRSCLSIPPAGPTTDAV